MVPLGHVPISKKQLVFFDQSLQCTLDIQLAIFFAISYEMQSVMDSFVCLQFLGYKGHICGNRIVSSVYSQPLGCQHKCAHLQTRSPEGSFGSFHPCEQ